MSPCRGHRHKRAAVAGGREITALAVAPVECEPCDLLQAMLVPVGTPARDMETVKHAAWLAVLAAMIIAGIISTLVYRRQRRAA